MSQLASLDAIGRKFGTDKSSAHHNYLRFYETFFQPLRHEPLTVLEIGVFGGASLRTWEEFFPRARIIGADIDPKARNHEGGRVTIEILDQSNIENLVSLGMRHGPFDILIEDGSHFWEHQTTTLRTLFPFVKNNGIYIVEDLQTNYGSLAGSYRGVATSSCVAFLKEWLDLRVSDDMTAIEQVEDAFLRTYGRAADFLTFYRRACLIKKSLRETPVNAPAPIVYARLAPALGNARSSPVHLAAHVGHIGDVHGRSGVIDFGSDENSFQGLAIQADDVLEYRVREPDGVWTAWSRANGFVGTRGLARDLTGVTVRLLPEHRARHRLHVFARFAGGGGVVGVEDGQDCVGPSGTALCGLQIDLYDRT